MYVQKIKEKGCNAIRFSHNPMAPELLDLCDQMGFLVINEAFDKWKLLYYEQLFDEWWERDLNAMLKMLVQHCHLVDPTRPVTCALEPHNWPIELRTGSIEDKVAHNKKLAEVVFPYYRGKDNRVKGYKPISYLQESLWSDASMVHIAVIDDMAKEKPTPQWTMHWKSLELVSHWNYSHYESKLLRVVTFTNCETVELIVNDESYGVKQEIVSRHLLQTARQPNQLMLHTNRTHR